MHQENKVHGNVYKERCQIPEAKIDHIKENGKSNKLELYISTLHFH